MLDFIGRARSLGLNAEQRPRDSVAITAGNTTLNPSLSFLFQVSAYKRVLDPNNERQRPQRSPPPVLGKYTPLFSHLARKTSASALNNDPWDRARVIASRLR